MDRTIRGTRYRGFTLIELLVTLTVTGILMGAAAPSFHGAIANSRQTATYNALVGAMRLARSEAIKQSSSVAVCARAANSADTCGSSWNEGWLVFTDGSDTPGVVDGDEIILRVEKKPTNNMSVDNFALLQNNAGSPIARSFIRFGPRGTSNWRGAGSYRLCDDRGTEHALAINITLSGDVRKSRRNATDQLLDAFGGQVTCP